MNGEAVTFWVIAPIAVLGGLGLVLSRKAVHAALCAALAMMCLAILYVTQEAPFLGVVQAFVYTGAIMMLFLFVLMVVGVDASDSLVETIRGQRVAAILAALGFGLLLTVVLGRATLGSPKGLSEKTPDGNIPAVADLIFTRYVWAFEVTSALLITAAVGAMVLAHRERVRPRLDQRELSRRRFRDTSVPTTLPSPGVYARHNAVDTPALLPDGSASPLSLSEALVSHGTVRPVSDVAVDVPAVERAVQADPDAPEVSERDTRSPLDGESR